MKTLRISDETHKKLTATLGTLMAQTKKLQTYSDVIETLLSRSIILNQDLLVEVEKCIKENKQQGYITREEFIAEATRLLLKMKSKKYQYIEVPIEKYEKLTRVIKQMKTPFYSAEEYIKKQIDDVLQNYGTQKQ
jgi:uncharacterized HAD superfamily protein